MCSTIGPQGTCVACGADGTPCCDNYWCASANSYCDGYVNDAGIGVSVCSSACGGPGQPTSQ
jgi:hypothetical protein